MKLTIFGATGSTGQRLLERTIAQGHEVTAFYRNPSKMKARHERLIRFQGDVSDSEAVEEAITGREAVISVLGGKPSNPLHPLRAGVANGPGSVSAENIVAAMSKHGVRRFVCQTAWGTAESRESLDIPGFVFVKLLMPLLLRDEYADKDVQERIIRHSGLDWIIVRPMILTNGRWTGNYRAGTDLMPGCQPYISRADVADFLTRQLTDEAFLGQTPAIGY